MELLFTIGAFIVALAILIAVHEFGHFWVARRLGVKVLRFSIGFGRALVRWRGRSKETEYVIAAVPFGGYVKMLDEREDDVPEDQLGRAFNRQPLWKRTAIVLAGPGFNLVFAVLAYWCIFVVGDVGLRPMVGAVEPESIAAESGFRVGDELLRVGDRPAGSWETAVFALTVEAMEGSELSVKVADASGLERERRIPGEVIAELAEEPDLLGRLGLKPQRPELPAVIGELVAGEPAERAGLEVGDRLLAADGVPIDSWGDWVEWVRERPGQAILLDVQRGDTSIRQILIRPRSVELNGEAVGRIGAGVRVPEGFMDGYRVLVRYGPVDALNQAIDKTLDMSVLMLRIIGRMLIGEASVRNLSGPITIAETAGRTASYGAIAFMKFLAVVSISLGILNLLPIPLLDGGHLVYFLIEWVKGSPVSEQAQLQGQKVGFILLAALMTLAFYLDLSRLLG